MTFEEFQRNLPQHQELMRSVKDWFTVAVVAARKVVDGKVVEYLKDIPALKYKVKPAKVVTRTERETAVDFQYDGTKIITVDGERIVLSNGKRASLIEQYRNDATAGRDITYDVDEPRLDRNLRAFAAALELDLEE